MTGSSPETAHSSSININTAARACLLAVTAPCARPAETNDSDRWPLTRPYSRSVPYSSMPAHIRWSCPNEFGPVWKMRKWQKKPAPCSAGHAAVKHHLTHDSWALFAKFPGLFWHAYRATLAHIIIPPRGRSRCAAAPYRAHYPHSTDSTPSPTPLRPQ